MKRELAAIVVVATAGTWLLTALWVGLPSNFWDAAKPFVSALTVASVVLVLFEKWAWKLPIIRSQISKMPDLIGVWRVKIRYNWVDEDHKIHRGEKTGYAQIDQSAASFCLRVFTDESKSETLAHSFSLDQNVFKMAIVYENQPSIERRQKLSVVHKGSAVFSIRGYRPEVLEGEYWTERRSVGEMTLSDRRKGEINSFSEGDTIYSQP